MRFKVLIYGYLVGDGKRDNIVGRTIVAVRRTRSLSEHIFQFDACLIRKLELGIVCVFSEYLLCMTAREFRVS